VFHVLIYYFRLPSGFSTTRRLPNKSEICGTETGIFIRPFATGKNIQVGGMEMMNQMIRRMRVM